LVPKCKAKNQRKERLRPLLFPEENPSVRPSVSYRPGRFCCRKCKQNAQSLTHPRT
jgi:hypothetical protein